VVSSKRTDFRWTNSHHIAGDLRTSVQKLKDATPAACSSVAASSPTELDRLDLIDEYKFLLHPRVAGHGPTLFQSGLPSTRLLELVSATPLRNSAVAMHYRRARGLTMGCSGQSAARPAAERQAVSSNQGRGEGCESNHWHITRIETIAVGRRIRELPRRQRVYGPGRWRKLKGVARVRVEVVGNFQPRYTGTKPPGSGARSFKNQAHFG